MNHKNRPFMRSFFLIVFCLALVLAPGVSSGAEQDVTTKDLNEQLVMATLWTQASAEYRALCYQAFNLARMNLDAFTASYRGAKPMAVVVDADETILDNGPLEAVFIGRDFGFSDHVWEAWVKAAQAEALPGAVEFLKYAASKKVEVFYITNRAMKSVEYTRKNMEALGFPFLDQKHLLLQTDTGSKKKRLESVALENEIVLLMGDNLNDFSDVFYKKSVAERFDQTDRLRREFGRRFIVLPNPMYGAWEGAVYNGNWGASPAEKDKMRKSFLKRWDYQPNQ